MTTKFSVGEKVVVLGKDYKNDQAIIQNKIKPGNAFESIEKKGQVERATVGQMRNSSSKCISTDEVSSLSRGMTSILKHKAIEMRLEMKYNCYIPFKKLLQFTVYEKVKPTLKILQYIVEMD